MKVRDASSKVYKIRCGVPQGSILGPLLFKFFINDIYLASDLLSVLFSDDTALLSQDKYTQTLYKKTNEELELIG